MQNEFDASATFYPLSKGGFSPGLRGLGRDANQSRTFNSSLTMSVVVIPLSLYAFLSCTGTVLPLPLYLHRALNKVSKASDYAWIYLC
jgi:hypothetical protein